MHSHTCTRIHTLTVARICTHACIHAYTHTHVHAHTNSHSHTHACIHTQTHTLTHAHTYMHNTDSHTRANFSRSPHLIPLPILAIQLAHKHT